MQFERYWSKALSTFTCSTVVQTLVSWMVARLEGLDLPQVTSYDYDALLDEEGNPTAKYLAVKKMMATHFPEYPQLEPLYKESMEIGSIPLVEKFCLKPWIACQVLLESLYPKKDGELGTKLWLSTLSNRGKLGCRRGTSPYHWWSRQSSAFVDGQWIETQYQTEIGEDIFYQGKPKGIQARYPGRKYGASTMDISSWSGYAT